jgi:putative ABC transport system ATP-binding protein
MGSRIVSRAILAGLRPGPLDSSLGPNSYQIAALRGVDLEVKRGELLMLVGPSGCGKTSLISIIATLLNQDAGLCEVLGEDFQRLEPLSRARFRNEAIGFVFQVLNLLPALTVIENISLPLLIAGQSRKQAEARAVELTQRVGLDNRRGALPIQLSGGEQQRVAIARALAGEPRLLICDEPTSSLDHESGQLMMRLLEQEAKSPNRAVIVVTHDPRIVGFADRIARMDDGRIIEIEEAHGRA